MARAAGRRAARRSARRWVPGPTRPRAPCLAPSRLPAEETPPRGRAGCGGALLPAARAPETGGRRQRAAGRAPAHAHPAATRAGRAAPPPARGTKAALLRPRLSAGRRRARPRGRSPPPLPPSARGRLSPVPLPEPCRGHLAPLRERERRAAPRRKGTRRSGPGPRPARPSQGERCRAAGDRFGSTASAASRPQRSTRAPAGRLSMHRERRTSAAAARASCGSR